MTATETSTGAPRARVTLGVDGLTSDTTAHTVESALADLPTLSASADVPSRTLQLEFDRTACALPEIASRLDKLGLRLRHSTSINLDPSSPPPRRASRVGRFLSTILHNRELLCATVGGLLLVGAVASNLAGGPAAVRYTLVGLSFVIAGYYTVVDAAKILLALRFDIDVLMLAAAFGAAILGHFEEGAFLLVLFALGGAGEQLAMDRARSAIEALSKLAPDTATVRDPVTGDDAVVPVERLKPGDVVVVRPYDRLPADGTVHVGTTAVDQSPITGESVPVDKQPGDAVYAGTINGDALILVSVAKPASESTLSKIVRMVEEAQASKSPTQQFTEKVETWYVPFVLISTALLIIVPPLLGLTFHLAPDRLWSGWFYRAMAFLTAASPCALAIGTPAAVLSGIARAAKLGVLVKGGAHLETLGRIQSVAFDKTGTLTRGRPTVTDMFPLPGAFPTRNWELGTGNPASQTRNSEPGTRNSHPNPHLELLRLAAAVEKTSSHPLAQAIVAAATSRHLDIPEAQDAQQSPGQGVVATVEHRRITAGRAEMLGSHAPESLTAAVERFSSEGKSTVVISADDRPLGVLALADRPRHNAADTLARLKKLGLTRTIMLTGDKLPVAQQIARTVGVDETHAELMPEDKLTLVRELEKRHGPIAMVGDGVNDAPALAAASVGIAMGSAGTDVAIETADVALMGDDLQKLPDAIALSRFSRRIIAQNLTIALGVIAVLAPLSALGYTYLGVAVLFHEGSTVVVVLNALRLLAFKPK